MLDSTLNPEALSNVNQSTARPDLRRHDIGPILGLSLSLDEHTRCKNTHDDESLHPPTSLPSHVNGRPAPRVPARRTAVRSLSSHR